ncbi:MAG: Ig-like domain-containing protein, partial [Candidatus Neomarinimicrobiota bacterium]
LGDQMSVYLTIAEDADTDSVTITAHALTGSGSIAVRLDFAPEALDDTLSVPEDSTMVLALLLNDRHPPADQLRIIDFSSALQGTVSVQPGDTTVSYSPARDYFGPDSFTYTVVDTGSESSQATVWLTILPVNDAPVLTSAQADIAYHEERYVYRAEATDVDDNSLLFSFISQITWLETTDSDSVAGTPGAADSGGTLIVKVTDGEAWDSISVVISVLPPNHPPVAMNDSISTPEDKLVVVAVISNDYDPDGDRPFISAVIQGQHGEVARQSGDTTLMYTPEADFNGLDQFIYTISDAGGLTASAEVAVTVVPVNDIPEIASPAEVSVIQHESFAYQASAVDVDGDFLSMAVYRLLTWMTAVDSSLVVGTPELGDSGGVFLVTAWDGQVYDSLEVTVVVVMVNHRPQAVDDTITTPEDSIAIVPVLANDHDPDGEPLEVIILGAGRKGGQVTAAGDTALAFTPRTNYFGPDTFAYAIRDSAGMADTALVMVTILPVNDPPGPFKLLSPATGARIELHNGNRDYSLVFTWESASDVEGDPVTYSFRATPALAGAVNTGPGADTSFSQLYSDLADALLETAERRLTGSWTIQASDGLSTADAADGPFVIILDATLLALELEVAIPGAYALEQNYPNPFNPVTTIPFALPEEDIVSMTIHDLRGREILRLIATTLPAGYHQIAWNGCDAKGRFLPSGIYLAVMKTPKFVAQRKVVLLR